MPNIEVLQTAASAPAPGWAYVVDRFQDPSKAALAPSGSRKAKRAVRSAVVADGELTRAQQVAIQRRIADLDRDGGREVIEVPREWRGVGLGIGGIGDAGKGPGGGKKVTTNVRRILLSEKTFLHHLGDEEAARALRTQEGGNTAGNGERRNTVAGAQSGNARRASNAANMTSSTAMLPPPTPTTPAAARDTPQASSTSPPAALPQDDEPLLQASVPALPTSEEIEALLSAPPLSYTAARAAPPLPPSQGGPPHRHFCELCGYWGRARCMRCGARVCGLECKDKHDPMCPQKYA